ncbi:hypothetical protein Esti_005962 [Eimeria stiedai]
MNTSRLPPPEAPPVVFSRRRRGKSREAQGSSKQQQQHGAAAATAAAAVGCEDEMATIAQETPATPARAFTASSHAIAATRLIHCHSSKGSGSWSSSSSKDSISSSSTDARDREGKQSEVLPLHPLDQAAEVAAAVARPPVTAAAALSTAATAERSKWGSSRYTAGKKVRIPSQLQTWLLFLLLLQCVLLLGLWMQRRQLQQEKEDSQQHAVSLQLVYQHGEQRLLNSRRSRLGLKQQQVQQQHEYCRCKPCARPHQSAEYIDLGDRFKHTQRDVELSVDALLKCLDAAATTLEETYEGTLNLPWKRKLEDKLMAMQDQETPSPNPRMRV